MYTKKCTIKSFIINTFAFLFSILYSIPPSPQYHYTIIPHFGHSVNPSTQLILSFFVRFSLPLWSSLSVSLHVLLYPSDCPLPVFLYTLSIGIKRLKAPYIRRLFCLSNYKLTYAFKGLYYKPPG